MRRTEPWSMMKYGCAVLPSPGRFAASLSPGERGAPLPPRGEGGRVSGRMRVFGAIRSEIVTL